MHSKPCFPCWTTPQPAMWCSSRRHDALEFPEKVSNTVSTVHPSALVTVGRSFSFVLRLSSVVQGELVSGLVSAQTHEITPLECSNSGDDFTRSPGGKARNNLAWPVWHGPASTGGYGRTVQAHTNPAGCDGWWFQREELDRRPLLLAGFQKEAAPIVPYWD